MPKIHQGRPATYSYPVGLLPAPAVPAEQRSEEDAPPPPAASANRTAWVKYAAAARPDLVVEGLTKAQIRKKVT